MIHRRHHNKANLWFPDGHAVGMGNAEILNLDTNAGYQITSFETMYPN